MDGISPAISSRVILGKSLAILQHCNIRSAEHWATGQGFMIRKLDGLLLLTQRSLHYLFIN